MAVIYASLILKGKKTFYSVPAALRTAVADILIDDTPELVPVEYGGTMEV